MHEPPQHDDSVSTDDAFMYVLRHSRVAGKVVLHLRVSQYSSVSIVAAIAGICFVVMENCYQNLSRKVDDLALDLHANGNDVDTVTRKRSSQNFFLQPCITGVLTRLTSRVTETVLLPLLVEPHLEQCA